MSSDSSSPPDQPPPKGLPPVAPPSGRHIFQMFVVPGLIVAVVVVIFLGCSGFWGWIFGLSSTPEGDLAQLESPNPDIRWRAASNLAQVLKRDNDLACDPAFGLKLVTLLGQELDKMDAHGKELARQKAAGVAKADFDKEMQDFRTRRETIRYLSACLGNMTVPVGAPLLVRMAGDEKGFDEKTTVLLRRHAVWMLANLAENMKRLTPKQKPEVLQQFIKHPEPKDPHAQKARLLAVDYLTALMQPATKEKPITRPALGVVPVLAECANSEDIFLREMVALALGLWTPAPIEASLAEQTLVKLSRDNGFGRRIEVKEGE